MAYEKFSNEITNEPLYLMLRYNVIVVVHLVSPRWYLIFALYINFYLFIYYFFCLSQAGVRTLRCSWKLLGADARVSSRISRFNRTQSGTSVSHGKKNEFFKTLSFLLVRCFIPLCFVPRTKFKLIFHCLLQSRMNEVYQPIDTIHQYLDHFGQYRKATGII